jgi:glycosyltransferase involved in cell wall biosynthesis
MTALATVLIPAYNEAGVILRTLSCLQAGIAQGTFRIVVIANACTDATAEVARSAGPDVIVLETPVAGKCHAMNLGLTEALADRPVICLDADLDVSAASILQLIAPLRDGTALATCGRMAVDTTGCSVLVRAWVRAWQVNPYFARGKFGGLFALSPEGVARVFPLPQVTGDDEWVRRAFSAEEVTFVPGCSFESRAPRRIGALIRTRRRSLRGARAVSAMGRATPEQGSAKAMLRAALPRPGLWFAMLVYTAVMVWVRVLLAFERPVAAGRWERDLTTRPGA